MTRDIDIDVRYTPNVDHNNLLTISTAGNSAPMVIFLIYATLIQKNVLERISRAPRHIVSLLTCLTMKVDGRDFASPIQLFTANKQPNRVLFILTENAEP